MLNSEMIANFSCTVMSRFIVGVILLISLLFDSTAVAQQKYFPWGRANLHSSQSGMNIQFVLHHAETDTAAKTSYTCYYAIAPKAKIQLQVRHHSAHTLSGKISKFSSSLEQVRQQVPSSGSSLVTLKGYRWFRGQRLAELSVAPLVRYGQTVQSVDTIDVTLSGSLLPVSATSANDKQFQSVLNALEVNSASSFVSTEALTWSDSTKAWIPINGKAIKITIPGDGVYRLSYVQLTSIASELAQADPTTFQLFNKGHELPMTVNTVSAHTFSAGDYLEFVGTKNYNPDTLYRIIPTGEEEYSEYLNRYTDTSYYWLEWGSASGARYTTNDTTVTPNDSLFWYTENVHIEQNTVYAYCGDDAVEQQNPYWTSGDMWVWTYIYAGGSCDPTFSATQIQSGAFSPRILMKVAGSAAISSIANAHMVQIGINSTLLPDTSILGPFEQSILRRAISTSILTEGTNTLHLYSYASASSTNSIVFDWADVEYPRSLTATDDSLWFGFHDLSGTAVRRVVLHGLASNSAVIYKSGKYPKRILGTVDGSGTYTVSFVDTVRNGDRYVIVSSAKIATPLIAYKSAFVDLRNSSRHADYLLITDSSFLSLAEQYTAFIQSTYGLMTAIINIKDIFDEFGYGYPVPEAEREFLKATTNWTSPMPLYVLLVGEANYDFKNYLGIAEGSYVRNVVPVFGMPVSDQWIAKLYDSLDIPQMYLGRLPVASTDEFQRYFTRLQTYVTQTSDVWNKRYMFFAGGSTSSEYSTFHSVNQQVINEIIQPRPIGGIAIDFYKTSNPVSSFGPYTTTQIANAIDSSALMITYIGHSGTETWDNDINKVTDLANTVGRFPFISDFGCSTGKFAEPNISSFSEQFVVGSNSSAIGYIGNSSLGFESIATTLPEYFFEEVMADSTHTIGKDHLLGKILTLNQNGWNNSAMGRQLMLTNTLIGDPAVRLAIPSLPNLVISSSLITSSPSFPSDDNDVISLTIPYHNLGAVPTDTFKVKVTHTYLTTSSDTIFALPVPLYADTIHLSYVVKNLPGEHTFVIQLNPARTVSESNYSDNSCEYSVVVQTAVYRIAYPVPGLNCPPKKFILLNPVKKPSDTNAVTIMIDTSDSFSTASSYTAPIGQVVTSFTPADIAVKRYYWKTSGSLSPTSGSFVPSSDSLTRWTQTVPSEWTTNSYSHCFHDSTGVHLLVSTYSIEIVSSGRNTIDYGAVKVNGINLLGSTFNRGITIVQLDTMDYHAIQQQSFDTYGDSTSSTKLIKFLEAMPNGSLVAMVVIDDAFNGVLIPGSSSPTPAAANAIKEFGSAYIDKLTDYTTGWRASWALLGRKGDPVGTALEGWYIGSDSLRVQLDTTFIRPALSGYVLSPSFGPSSQWKQAAITKTTPAGSNLGMYVLGTTLTGSVDTLVTNDTSSTLTLASFSAKKYRTLQLLGKFTANASGETPLLKNWNVLLKPPPELAINYQCVSITSDTLMEGKSLGITAKIYNAGEQPADSVKVVFTLMNNGIRQKDTVIIPVVPADSFTTVTYSLATTGRAGSNTEILSIDPQQSIPEIYTINNYYSVSFYVQTDTTRPTFAITFDGQRIYNGDYVLPSPTIKIAIYDNSPLPISDPSSVYLALDGRRVALGPMPDSLFISQSGQSGNAKASVTYHPTLATGDHTLSVRVMDASGNYSDSVATQIQFRVETNLKLLDVFNYPNPFASETYFTFILTDYADEIKIKIYTIAGRLIQDIQVPPQANAYYRVYWNGRDHDGDNIANGIYFYKVIAKSNKSGTEVIQKLAKVR